MLDTEENCIDTISFTNNEVEPDEYLIQQVQTSDDEEALKELIQRHTPLCHAIFNKFYPSIQESGAHFQDLIQDKDLIIYNSAKNFDTQKKTKFSSWLGQNLKYQCMSAVRDESKYSFVGEEYISNSPAPSHMESDETVDYIFNILDSLKDKRVAEVFKLRYFDSERPNKNTSWGIVADTLGVSIQTAINLHDKGKNFIANKLNLESLDFV